MSDTKILAVAGGFYFYGKEVQAADGYVALQPAFMFGGFGGGLGLPGVARGAKGATVTLDRLPGRAEYPLESVYAIMESVDLEKFEGTTLRGEEE